MKATEKLIRAENQVKYINNHLSEDMPPWERKEWEATKKEYEEEIIELTEHIKIHNL